MYAWYYGMVGLVACLLHSGCMKKTGEPLWGKRYEVNFCQINALLTRRSEDNFFVSILY